MSRYSNSDVPIEFCVVGLILAVVLFWCASCVGANSVESEVHKYKYLIANGVYYSTSNIESVDYTARYRESDCVEFYLRDGTVIRCKEGQYTLTNTDKGE